MKSGGREKHPARGTAEYACGDDRTKGCGHAWTGRPGPTFCPRCGNQYIRWLDFEAPASPPAAEKTP